MIRVGRGLGLGFTSNVYYHSRFTFSGCWIGLLWRYQGRLRDFSERRCLQGYKVLATRLWMDDPEYDKYV